MQKALKMERDFECDKNLIFELLENDFKKVNEIKGNLHKGLEVEYKAGLLKIIEFEKNKILSVQIITAKDTYIQTYQFEGADETTQMNYEEMYDSNSMLRILNFKLVRRLNRKKYYQRANQMFLSIEEKIEELN